MMSSSERSGSSCEKQNSGSLPKIVSTYIIITQERWLMMAPKL